MEQWQLGHMLHTIMVLKNRMAGACCRHDVCSGLQHGMPVYGMYHYTG